MYLLSVEVGVSKEGSSGSGEGHHWQWHGNGNIDAHLSDVDVLGELAGGGSVGCEDGGTVAVAVTVDQLNSLVQSVHIDLG